MNPLTIADAATMVLGLQDEIRRSEESRYDHRLHGVLLVAQGLTCPEVSQLLGDAHGRSNTGFDILKSAVWPDWWKGRDPDGPSA